MDRIQTPASTTAPKCGPRTVSHSVGGGLTYLHCAHSKGHDGPHAPQAAPADSDPDPDEALRRVREDRRPAVAA